METLSSSQAAHICPADSSAPVSQRKAYIEFMRIAAAFLVIVNHTNSRIFLSQEPSVTWFSSLTYFFICKIAVPVFLLIMGAVSLGKQESLRKSMTRVGRILVVTVIFSAVYYIHDNWSSPAEMHVVDFFKTIFSRHITNAFWYLYLYIGLLCLLPLLRKMAAAFSKRDIQLLLLLSLGVLGVRPLFSIFFNIAPSSYLTVSFFSSYIGLLFAGYYIERYMDLDGKKFIIACGSFVLLIALQVIGTWFLYQKDASSYLALDNRTLITITGSAICFYIMVKYLFQVIRFPKLVNKVIVWVGALTFGVYLFADLIIALSQPLYTSLTSHMYTLFAMICWELFIFLFAMLISFALKTIPFLSKWL